MKPKTTLNLLKVFFSNIIQKTILFLTSFFEKKMWSNTIGITYSVPLVSYSSTTFAKSVFKITTTKTDKCKNVKNAPPEEKYYYALQIAII
jgi:hypothetical protein